MTEGQTSPGFDLLYTLRRFEQSLNRMREDWMDFRDRPTPERLAELERTFARASADLGNLVRRVRGYGALSGVTHRGEVPAEHLPGSYREAEAGDRPGARAVIEASRRLDVLFGRMNLEWRECRSRLDPAGFDALLATLRSALESIDVLARALGSVPRTPARPTTGEPHPDGSPESEEDRQMTAWAGTVQLSARELEINALLWRISTDWHQLRLDPAPDRIGLLRDELTEVMVRLSSLRAAVASTEPSDVPSAEPSLEEAPGGVSFQPYRDAFTGAYNREGFDVLASAELKRCRRYGRPFGLLLIDVGPGDLARLRSEVTLVREALRDYDLLARYVDRTLAVGLPESGSAETRLVASRVLRALRSAGAAADVRRLTYATLPDDGYTLSRLIAASRARQREQAEE